MTVKSFRQMATNGLLTDKQSETLVTWFNSKKRIINQRDLADKIGVSRNKIYNSFKHDPKRPFDEIKLGIVNRFIAAYNEDIELIKAQSKNDEDLPAKKSKVAKKRVNDLISKVER